MRPRHEASENREKHRGQLPPRQASMRPRHEASENQAADHQHPAAVFASMRPRHEASENRHEHAVAGCHARLQ